MSIGPTPRADRIDASRGGAPAPPPGGQTVDAFVGRETELALLDRAVDDAANGHGRCVFLLGEPGMGKTRTAEELAVTAERRGAQILWGRCYEGEGAPPFWPLIQVIRAAACILDEEELRTVVGRHATDLLAIVPQLRDRLTHLVPQDQPDLPRDRFRAFEAVERFVDHLGRRAPLIVILDDLHGADESSLLLLRFVVRQLRHKRLLIIGTSRAEEAHTSNPLRETILDALREPGTKRIAISGLSETDLTRFVEVRLGCHPTPGFVRALHRRTEGNPFFAGEILRTMAVGGPSPLTDRLPDGGLPETVKAVVLRRLAPLSENCRDILTVAGVIGRDFSLPVLRSVLDNPSLKRSLPESLGASVAANVLVRRDNGSDGFRFAHALIAEVLYEDIDPARRAELHRRIGRALEADADGHLSELTHHFVSAGGRGDLGKAAEYGRRAGDDAMSRLACEEAIRLYKLALRALTGNARFEPADDGTRCGLLLALAAAQRRSGNRAAARATELEVVALARRLRRSEPLALAAIGDGHEGFVAGVLDRNRVRLLDEALVALGSETSILKVRVAGQLAQALASGGSVAGSRPERLAKQAVAGARRLKIPLALAEALLAQHWVLGTSPDIEKRSAVSQEALQTALTAADMNLVMACRELRVRDLLELGDVDGFGREVEAQLRDAEEFRQPVWLGQSAHLQAVRAMLAGRINEADALAERGFSHGREVNPEGAAQLLGVQLFLIRREQGRLAELELAVRAQADAYPAAPAFRCALALVLTEGDRTTEARIEVDRLATDEFAALRTPHNAPNVCAAYLAEVCAALADADNARRLYALLRPYATRNIVLPFTFLCTGPGDYYLGLLAATMRRWDDAERHLEASERMATRMGAPAFLARTEIARGQMLLSRGKTGDIRRARALVEQATRTAATFGLVALERRGSALLSSWPGTLRAEPAIRVTPGATGSSKRMGGTEPNGRAVFHREGDYWIVGRGGEITRLKHAKGLSYISYLLSRPGAAVHVIELASEGYVAPATLAGATGGSVGPVLDARARAEYTRRLAELRAEIDEAENNRDLGRLDLLRKEMAILSAQIAGAIGLGGRSRHALTAAERARSAIRKRIADTINRIRKDAPVLGDYLHRSIRTGLVCTYVPPAESPVEWEL